MDDRGPVDAVRQSEVLTWLGRRFGRGLLVGAVTGGVVVVYIELGSLVGLLAALIALAAIALVLVRFSDLGVMHCYMQPETIRLEDLSERDRRRLIRQYRREHGFKPRETIPKSELDPPRSVKREIPYGLQIAALVSGMVSGVGGMVIALVALFRGG
jgi:hypothetical protein